MMPWLKYFHVGSVILSFSGFSLRGYWRLRAPQRLQRTWVKQAPHWVDSALLLSGLTMVLYYHWSPLRQPWLMAKLVALVVYVGLGAVALRRGRAWQVFAALAVFLYIVSVALTKNPMPWTV